MCTLPIPQCSCLLWMVPLVLGSNRVTFAEDEKSFDQGSSLACRLGAAYGRHRGLAPLEFLPLS